MGMSGTAGAMAGGGAGAMNPMMTMMMMNMMMQNNPTKVKSNTKQVFIYARETTSTIV